MSVWWHPCRSVGQYIIKIKTIMVVTGFVFKQWQSCSLQHSYNQSSLGHICHVDKMASG